MKTLDFGRENVLFRHLPRMSCIWCYLHIQFYTDVAVFPLISFLPSNKRFLVFTSLGRPKGFLFAFYYRDIWEFLSISLTLDVTRLAALDSLYLLSLIP